MKKGLFALCISIIISSCAVSTVSVSGSVFDENGSPLKYCTVYTSRHNGVLVDSTGRYTIPVPSRGKTKIHFASIGYKNIFLEYSPDKNSDSYDVKMEIDSTVVF